jgi:3-oxoacyl-[acyl-carrier-protein] synthase-3
MPSVKRVGIAGLGYYVPEKIISNSEFAAKLDTSDEWIRTRTGILERRMAAPEQAASDLGLQASRAALADAGMAAEDLDMILVATSSPDMVFPATACRIQHLLGATKAAACDVSAVCSGFLYAFIMGSQMIQSGQAERILVVGAEKFTSLLDFDDRSTCVLMGDGAGAAILTSDAPRGELLACTLGADSSGLENLWIPAGGSARPASHESVDQRLHYMKMNGQEIYKFGVRIIGESVPEVLAKAGLKVADMDLLIPHQANIRIIQSAAKHFGLPMDKIAINIDRFSNTSGASVPIALTECKQSGRLKPGMNVVLVAFGAGLTWGAAALKW